MLYEGSRCPIAITRAGGSSGELSACLGPTFLVEVTFVEATAYAILSPGGAFSRHIFTGRTNLDSITVIRHR